MLIPGHLTGCGEIPAEPPVFLASRPWVQPSLPRHHGNSSAGHTGPWLLVWPHHPPPLSPEAPTVPNNASFQQTHITYDPACLPLHVVPVIPKIALDLGFAWAILTQTSALETEASSWPTAFPPVPFLHSGKQAKAFSVILLPCCIPAVFFPLSLPVDTPCVFLSLQG